MKNVKWEIQKAKINCGKLLLFRPDYADHALKAEFILNRPGTICPGFCPFINKSFTGVK
jgi:hypothetical protein